MQYDLSYGMEHTLIKFAADMKLGRNVSKLEGRIRIQKIILTGWKNGLKRTKWNPIETNATLRQELLAVGTEDKEQLVRQQPNSQVYWELQVVVTSPPGMSQFGFQAITF